MNWQRKRIRLRLVDCKHKGFASLAASDFETWTIRGSFTTPF